MTAEIDDDLALLREVAAELRAMAEQEAIALEHLEPLAARIGLSADATAMTIDLNRRRLRALTYAHQIFERRVAALTKH